jgi:uncharacterized membrane protein YjgN (DUF898 family)
MLSTSDQFLFDGDVAGHLRVRLAAIVVTIGTLGFGFPLGFVMVRRWKASHLTVDGRRLEFTGSARELFSDWLPWWILTLGTLGIYGFWVYPRVARWAWEHTVVVRPEPWKYAAAPEPARPLAAPSRLAEAYFTEAGMHQLVG